jgi:UDP-2,4-diacetamido-2,4,6-trideoxy-beta-L-altropyranose hydrolase
MRIVFRTDASIQIGSGHVMRCLTLADALKQQGAECYFICREHPGHLNTLIEEHGHQVHTLPLATQPESHKQAELAHAHWLGASRQGDFQQCQPLLQSLQPDWLIVDHYALDHHWQQPLRSDCRNIMVIDDLADRKHDCDLLLDQTFGRKAQDYQPLVPSTCEILCGSQYALLRPEFAQWREYSLRRREEGRLKQLLINLGGVDKDNITTQILKSLQNSALPKNCKITVVMGPSAPWVEEVKQEAKQLPWETEVKVGISNMAELMVNSDLAIGAAGATSWERCCLGLPTIMVVLADNQKTIANQLVAAGAALKINSQDLSATIPQLETKLTPDTLKYLSQSSASVCDGQGLRRVTIQLAEDRKNAY